MKSRGLPKGLLEQPEICGKCGKTERVRWIAIAASHYTFSGYICEDCEPTTGQLKIK